MCICNDRQSTKVRSLRNYCLDLSFRRPSAQMALPRMRGIARAEGLEVDADTMERILAQVNFDLRQALHLLQVWHMKQKSLIGLDVKQAYVGSDPTQSRVRENPLTQSLTHSLTQSLYLCMICE